MSVYHFIIILVLKRFLNSAFIINLQKKAPMSHFYSSQHVENRREENYVIHVYSFKNTCNLSIYAFLLPPGMKGLKIVAKL